MEGSLSGYVHHSDMLYKLWEELETAVLTGTNCWQPAFGLSSSDVFGSLYTNDAAVLRFMQGMDSFSQLSARAVLTAFDLSGFRVLVDWGGATGALAAAACSIYPELRGVVVDLPHVVQKAQEHFSTRPAALVSGTWHVGAYSHECNRAVLVTNGAYNSMLVLVHRHRHAHPCTMFTGSSAGVCIQRHGCRGLTLQSVAWTSSGPWVLCVCKCIDLCTPLVHRVFPRLKQKAVCCRLLPRGCRGWLVTSSAPLACCLMGTWWCWPASYMTGRRHAA